MRNRNFSYHLFKQILSLVLLAGVLCGAFPAGAQTRRTASKPRKATTAKTAPNASEQMTAQQNGTPLASAPKSALANVWESGSLPAPLALPAGNTDEVAAILAQKVMAKSDESIPALLTALQLSGFFITDKSGQVTLAPPDGKGQGLAINGWEIASAAKMLGEGRRTTLKDLNDRLKSIPQLRGAANAGSLLIEGVRQNHDNTKNPYLRVWARFVVELGKYSADKTDLTAGAVKPEEISLDPVQHLLIMRRLYGDLWVQTEKYRSQIPANQRGQNTSRESSSPRFVKASFSPDFNSQKSIFGQNSANLELADLKFNRSTASDDPPAQPPCRMDGNAPTVMDASAAGIGFGHGQFMGWLESVYENTPTETAIKKFGMYQALANILLAYAKVVHTYAALEMTITLEEGAPLVRTKNAAPGELKNLRADVRMNIGNWQFYNCVRLGLNIAGIDFATLNDGPLADVGVMWRLSQGGAGDYYSNDTGINESGEQIVGFTRKGKRIQDGGVGAGTTEENANYTKTDEKGVARIGLEGSPQKNYKSDRAFQVGKQARVYTTVRMKTGEIKGDAVDVLSQALGGLPGLWTMPAELLYRSDWAVTAALTVPVTDWEDCDGKGWSGTISITRKSSKEFTHNVNPGEMPVWKSAFSTTKTLDSFDYTGTVVVRNSPMEMYRAVNAPKQPPLGASARLEGEATATSERKNKEHYKSTNPDPSPCKGGVKKPISVERMSDSQTSGSLSATEVTGDLQIDYQTNRYNFRIGIPGFPAVIKTTGFINTEGYCTAARNKNVPSEGESTTSIYAQPISGEGTLDPKNPNLIEGSRTFTEAGGETVTIRWSLRNCR